MKLLSSIFFALAFCVAALAQTPQGYVIWPNQAYTASFSMNGYSQTYTVTGSTAAQQATLPPATTITALSLPNSTYSQTLVNGSSVTWTVAPGSGGTIYSLGGTPSTITVQAGETATFWYIGGGNWATTAVIQQIESVMLAANLAVTGAWSFSGPATFNSSVALNGAIQSGVQTITLNATPPTIAVGAANASSVLVTGSTASTSVYLPTSATMAALPNNGNGYLLFISSNATAAWTLSTNSQGTVAGAGTLGFRAYLSYIPPFAVLQYNYATTNWLPLSFNGTTSGPNIYASGITAATAIASNGTLLVSGNSTFSEGIVITPTGQSASFTTSQSVCFYNLTGGSGQTATLLASPTAGTIQIIANNSGSAWTVAPNSGQTLNLTYNTAGTLGVASGNISLPNGARLILTTANGGSSAVWQASAG
jgi:hypothetical protein